MKGFYYTQDLVKNSGTLRKSTVRKGAEEFFLYKLAGDKTHRSSAQICKEVDESRTKLRLSPICRQVHTMDSKAEIDLLQNGVLRCFLYFRDVKKSIILKEGTEFEFKVERGVNNYVFFNDDSLPINNDVDLFDLDDGLFNDSFVSLPRSDKVPDGTESLLDVVPKFIDIELSGMSVEDTCLERTRFIIPLCFWCNSVVDIEMRIIIIGNTGNGKSLFANKLANQCHCEDYYHMYFETEPGQTGDKTKLLRAADFLKDNLYKEQHRGGCKIKLIEGPGSVLGTTGKGKEDGDLRLIKSLLVDMKVHWPKIDTTIEGLKVKYHPDSGIEYINKKDNTTYSTESELEGFNIAVIAVDSRTMWSVGEQVREEVAGRYHELVDVIRLGDGWISNDVERPIFFNVLCWKVLENKVEIPCECDRNAEQWGDMADALSNCENCHVFGGLFDLFPTKPVKQERIIGRSNPEQELAFSKNLYYMRNLYVKFYKQRMESISKIRDNFKVGDGEEIEWECYGKSWKETDVCGGRSRGVCNPTRNCECQKKHRVDRREDSKTFGECVIWDCYGAENIDKEVCSGNGRCVDPNNCMCTTTNKTDTEKPKPLYTGDMCQYWQCFGVDHNDDQRGYCSGHGECVDYNSCSCAEGYYGDNCELWFCDGKWTRDDGTFEEGVCSGHGSCVSPGKCDCERGYETEENFCNYPECGNATHPCFMNGICDFPEGVDTAISNKICTCHEDIFTERRSSSLWDPYCKCKDGYFGDKCKSFTCFGIEENLSEEVCSGRGECKDLNTCLCGRGRTDCRVKSSAGLWNKIFDFVAQFFVDSSRSWCEVDYSGRHDCFLPSLKNEAYSCHVEVVGKYSKTEYGRFAKILFGEEVVSAAILNAQDGNVEEEVGVDDDPVCVNGGELGSYFDHLMCPVENVDIHEFLSMHPEVKTGVGELCGDIWCSLYDEVRIKHKEYATQSSPQTTCTIVTSESIYEKMGEWRGIKKELYTYPGKLTSFAGVIALFLILLSLFLLAIHVFVLRCIPGEWGEVRKRVKILARGCLGVVKWVIKCLEDTCGEKNPKAPESPSGYWSHPCHGLSNNNKKLGGGGLGNIYSARRDSKIMRNILEEKHYRSLGAEDSQCDFVAVKIFKAISFDDKDQSRSKFVDRIDAFEEILKKNKDYKNICKVEGLLGCMITEKSKAPKVKLIGMVMEKCGKNVGEVVFKAHREKKPYTDREILIIAYQAASALCVLHKNEVEHRDVKPGNLMFRREEEVKKIRMDPMKYKSKEDLEKLDGVVLIDFETMLSYKRDTFQSNILPAYSAGTCGYRHPLPKMVTPLQRDLYSFGKMLWALTDGKDISKEGDLASERKMVSTLIEESREHLKKQKWNLIHNCLQNIPLTCTELTFEHVKDKIAELILAENKEGHEAQKKKKKEEEEEIEGGGET